MSTNLETLLQKETEKTKDWKNLCSLYDLLLKTFLSIRVIGRYDGIDGGNRLTCVSSLVTGHFPYPP
jgi:hypothetical protein